MELHKLAISNLGPDGKPLSGVFSKITLDGKELKGVKALRLYLDAEPGPLGVAEANIRIVVIPELKETLIKTSFEIEKPKEEEQP